MGLQATFTHHSSLSSPSAFFPLLTHHSSLSSLLEEATRRPHTYTDHSKNHPLLLYPLPLLILVVGRMYLQVTQSDVFVNLQVTQSDVFVNLQVTQSDVFVNSPKKNNSRKIILIRQNVKLAYYYLA